MSQVNDVTIVTGSREDAAAEFISGHLTVRYGPGREFPQRLELVSDGKGAGGGKASGTCVYAACLNKGPLPHEWGEILAAAPWRLRYQVTAVFEFELFGACVWHGRAGWLMNCDDVAARGGSASKL